MSITTNAEGGLGLDLWLDGMKLVPKTAASVRGINIATDGTEQASSGDLKNIHQRLEQANYWQSIGEEISYYEVDFETARQINHVDYYTYFKPFADGSPAVLLPTAVELQFLTEAGWQPVRL